MEWKQTGFTWNPNNDKEISGKLINIQEEGGKYKTKVYTLITEQGVVDIFGNVVLDAKIQNICQIGNDIKIKFLGMKKSQDGTEYKDFECYLGVKTTE